jgi:hypothetical protein
LKFKDLQPKYTRKDLNGENFLCDLSCLKSADYRDVYEPNEDTYLLIDALNLESRHHVCKINPKIILEVGIGSGAVINSF